MKFILKWFKSRSSNEDGTFYSTLKDILGFKPKDIDIYHIAFTHRSMGKYDEEGNPISFERLEFLGDAILSSVISAYLYKEMPTKNEGYLTQMRSKIVSRNTLNDIGLQIGLKNLIKSKIPDKQFSPTLLGDSIESLLGAIYLDRGYPYAEKFVMTKIVETYVDLDKLENKISSYKSFIIEYCQKARKEVSFIMSEDKSHSKNNLFSIKLVIDGTTISKGRATSKKKAEEQAAKRAYYSIQSKIKKKK
ncbi:MAG: ribonuclease III [Flavobacteriales bacterium]|nr:ribonuclease III [Flavobacteriales bacterium]